MQPLDSHTLALIRAATYDNSVAYFNKSNPPAGSAVELLALPHDVRQAVETALRSPFYSYADVHKLPASKRLVVLTKHIGSKSLCLVYPEFDSDFLKDIKGEAQERLGLLTSWRLIKETKGLWPLGGVVMTAFALFIFHMVGSTPQPNLLSQILLGAVVLYAAACWLWMPISRTLEQRRLGAAMSYWSSPLRQYGGDPTGSAG